MEQRILQLQNCDIHKSKSTEKWNSYNMDFNFHLQSEKKPVIDFHESNIWIIDPAVWNQ